MKLSVSLKSCYDCKAFNYWLSNMLKSYLNNFPGKWIELNELADSIESVDDYSVRLDRWFSNLHMIKCSQLPLKNGLAVTIKFISW